MIKMKKEDLRKEYKKKGYFIVKNFLKRTHLIRILKDLNLIILKNKNIFYDKNYKIRRIEKIYNKSKNLRDLNKDILKFLKFIFMENFTIFKDKVNFKPPGGEGFYPHYDGIFHFYKNKKKMRGWYEYSNIFINCLVALDNCNKKNGALELAKEDKFSFDQLIKKTKKDGTQILLDTITKKKKFKKIILSKGDIVFFSNRCAHRSKKNLTKKMRRVLYYTYNPIKFGKNYLKYFKDKEQSKSAHKSISGAA